MRHGYDACPVRAIAKLKAGGMCPSAVERPLVKCLNSVTKGGQGRLKRIL